MKSLERALKLQEKFVVRRDMKNRLIVFFILLTSILMGACTNNLDPLSPGSTDGNYVIGEKSLVPLEVGNQWTYSAILYDTTGAMKTQYDYTLSVLDTVIADTGKIPMTSASRKGLSRAALTWHLLQGEMGVSTCWQVDTLENLSIRSSNDARFLEQTAFNFRASVGDTTAAKATSADISIWSSVDTSVAKDTVKTILISKGVDTLRTTLGSAPYFQYRQVYAKRTYYTDYTFKPGFGLIKIERYQRKANGAMVCTRQDKLNSYYFK
jgi:hypothetical protein